MRSIPFIILCVEAYTFFSRQPYEPCSGPGSTRWTASNGAKVTDSSDHTVERRLVNHRSDEQGRTIFLTLYGHASKPLRPAVVEATFHSKSIGVDHCTTPSQSISHRLNLSLPLHCLFIVFRKRFFYLLEFKNIR